MVWRREVVAGSWFGEDFWSLLRQASARSLFEEIVNRLAILTFPDCVYEHLAGRHLGNYFPY
jgi:hypothetical protein